MKEDLETKIQLTNARESFIIAARDADPELPKYLKAYMDASDRHYKAPIGFGQTTKKYTPKGLGWGFN